MSFGLDDVVELMAGTPVWWAIGGGWAIDLHLDELGRRPHKDVDLVCLEHEAPLLRAHLTGWDLHRVRDGALEPWDSDLAPAHQIWARRTADEPWAFEVLFEHIEEDEWRFRRNPLVTLAFDRLRTGIGDIPRVDLGVALVYKAKRDDDQDLEDLLACLQALGAEGRAWLADAVRITHGPDHRWVQVLG